MPTKKLKTTTATIKKPATVAAKRTSKTAIVKETPAKSTSNSPVRSSQSKNPFSPDGKMRNLKFDKRVSIPIVVVIILVILGYLANRYMVIAWVDNRPITRIEYYKDLSQKYGKDEKDQLIVKSLIESEAAKKGVAASNQEIDTQIAQITQQQGGESQLNQVLSMQNMTKDDLRKLVKLQILRQKLFSNGNTVTDADISQYIDQNKASLPEVKAGDASGEAKLRDNIRQQLLQDRVSATFSAWIQSNLNSNRVVRVQ